MMKHCMVDLETFNSKDFVVAIGAQQFDPNSDELGSKFNMNIDASTCSDIGCVPNTETMLWWMEQSVEARQSLFDPDPMPVRTVLGEFSKWWQSCGCEYFWCHATFDAVVLSNLYMKVYKNWVPWQFRNVRDIRTIQAMVIEPVRKGFVYEAFKHSAINDAIDQARYVQYMIKEGGLKVYNS